jgi:hypothetical protein
LAATAAEKEEQRMQAQGLQWKKVMGVLRALCSGLGSAGMPALALALGVACAQVARAQECDHYLGHAAPTATPHPWTVLDQGFGGNNGRVAVVVDTALYYVTLDPPTPDPELATALDTYVADLAADGYPYVLATFAGSVTDLRNEIRDLYYEAGVSLDGAVLIGGGLPWATLAGTGNYPFEGYLMDQDEPSADWLEDPPGSGRLHAWPGDYLAQVWVSRIKADQLPDIWVDARPATEREIVAMYFSRNHQFRWNAFNPQQRALAYYSSTNPFDYGMEDPGSAMLAALGSVDTVSVGYSQEDYIARLARQGPDPQPYNYIYELSEYGGQMGHGPGCVTGTDYIGAQSQALGIFMHSDYGGDFSWVPEDPGSGADHGCVAGDACFGLAAKTLVVSAYAAGTSNQIYPYALWTRVGAGRSYGDGYRAQFNLYSAWGMVLLGDGSIKGTSYDWTGGGDGVAWQDPNNWAGGQVPGWLDNTDRVRIDGAEVEVTGAPAEVWSIDLRDGAGLTISGDGSVLTSHASLIGENPEHNTLHMQPRTSLYLGQGSSGECGTLVNLNILMDDTPDGITHLSAEYGIYDCTPIDIRSNCQVDVGHVTRSLVSPVTGTLNVDTLWFCPSVTVGEGGAIHAGLVGWSTIAVPTGTLSADDGIYKCLVTVEECGELSAGGVSDSDLTMTGGTATITGEAYLQLDATDAIVTIGASAEGPDWNLSGTQLTTGVTCAYGNWRMDEATHAALTRLIPWPQGHRTLSFDLANGSDLTISEVPSDQPSFDDELEDELTYAGLGNQLLAGDGTVSQALHVGDQMRIRGEEGGVLALDLSCGLDIASDFMQEFVGQHWNTGKADVTLRAIPGQPEDSVPLEVISPVPGSMPDGPNVVFSDVPCDGKFRDLNVATREGADDGASVNVVNNHANHGAGREAGIYNTVTIGEHRTMKFSSSAGYIWYYSGQPPSIPTTGGFYLDGSELRSWSEHWQEVIKYAICTVYGDWNGNGRVEASELAALQTAINQGLYSSLMDGDCSGTLDNDDLNKFLGNYGNNLNGLFLVADDSADGFGAAGAEAEAAAEAVVDDGTDPLDLAELASWLQDQLSPDQLAAFVAEATATAAETTDPQVEAELTELLSYLQ